MNNNMDNNTKESQWKKRERGALWKKEGKSQNYLTGVIKSLDDMGQEVKNKVIVFSKTSWTCKIPVWLMAIAKETFASGQ